MKTAIIVPTEAAAGSPHDLLIITPRTIDRVRGVEVADLCIPREADSIPYSQAARIYEALVPAFVGLPEHRGRMQRKLIRWLDRVPFDQKPATPAAALTEALTAGELTARHIGATVDLTLDNGARVIDTLASVKHTGSTTQITFRNVSHPTGRYAVETASRAVIMPAEVTE